MWENSEYVKSQAVMYDVSGLHALPDFNSLLALSRFVVAHKGDRGPRVVAFVAPEFSGRSVRNIFAGFAKLVGLKMNYLPDRGAALAWFDSQLEHENS